MPVYFDNLRLKLLQRINTLDKAFDRHAIKPVLIHSVDRFSLQEGLASSLWQMWCAFCRDIVLASSTGAITANGTPVTSAHSAKTEGEIAYLARQYALNNKIVSVKPIAGRHQEPTWGDAVKLNLIVSGIKPSNQGTLLSSFGSMSTLRDLQTIRNASAHISPDALRAVTATRVRYSSTKFRHPSDAMFWIDPATRDYLWKSWVEEMDIISDLAIQ